MAPVCYLELDDEITGAIARLRQLSETEAILVVPAGSRIATSRINFKLLAREANGRKLNLVAVSDEPSVRALAISAGVPAYDSISSAESALKTFDEQDRQLAERIGRARSRSTKKVVDDKTQLMLTLPTNPKAPEAKERPVDWVIRRKTPGATPSPVAPPALEEDKPVAAAAGARRIRRVGPVPIVAAIVLLLLLAGVGYGAYLFLPTATITLRPTTAELRPAPFTVVADPNVAVADPVAGVVPAEWVDVPLTVTGQFTSTGVTTRETRATGLVRFRSENTLNDVPILQGTVVATQDGLDFETTEAAVVPRANFATSTPGQVDVSVRASRPGPSGNVTAGAITELSPSLGSQLITVRNPEPTDGGRRTEVRTVSQEDFDAALVALSAQLTGSLTTRLADPTSVPRGLTVFTATARMGTAQPDPPPETLVESEAESFALNVSNTATILAVNETLVDDVAEQRLRSQLQPGQQIVGDDITPTRSEGTVSGETVAFQVSHSAQVFAQPDQQALLSGVRGKSISDARQILSAYGMVDIAIWPEFVDRLPDQTARISLVVVPPGPQP